MSSHGYFAQGPPTESSLTNGFDVTLLPPLNNHELSGLVPRDRRKGPATPRKSYDREKTRSWGFVRRANYLPFSNAVFVHDRRHGRDICGVSALLRRSDDSVQEFAGHDRSSYWFNDGWLHESWRTEQMHENAFLEETAAQHGRRPHDHAMISAIQP